MLQYKGYRDKDGSLITLTEYNRYAQQARRKGMSTEKYLKKLGYTKVWGRGRPTWKSDLVSMVTQTNLDEISQKPI